MAGLLIRSAFVNSKISAVEVRGTYTHFGRAVAKNAYKPFNQLETFSNIFKKTGVTKLLPWASWRGVPFFLEIVWNFAS